MKVTELPINNLPFSLGYEYPFPIPPVSQDKDSGKWTVRVEVGRSWRGDNTTYSWDYFKTDADGLVQRSPRGHAKEYNKRVRITGLNDWKAS